MAVYLMVQNYKFTPLAGTVNITVSGAETFTYDLVGIGYKVYNLAFV